LSTLTFLQAQSVLDIPVLKVLAWSATENNPVGSEYIIMEEAKGMQLSEVWDSMELEDQLSIVNEIVILDQKFLSASFSRYAASSVNLAYI